MNETQIWLRAMLCDGPREARELRALAAQRGITPKALRGGRERLALVVTRHGSGRNMRSTWALPAGALDGINATEAAASTPSTQPCLAASLGEAPPTITVDATGKRYEPPLASVNVDTLSGDALKAYAKRVGVMQRDIDYLTEDRLRQNVKLAIVNLFDLITEG